MADFTDFFSYDPEKKKKDQEAIANSNADSGSGDNFTNFFAYDPEKQTNKKPSQIAAEEQKPTEPPKPENKGFFSGVADVIGGAAKKISEVTGIGAFLNKPEDNLKDPVVNKIETLTLDNTDHAVLSATNALKKVQDESVVLRSNLAADPNNKDLQTQLQKTDLAQKVYGIYVNNANDTKFDASFKNGVSRSGEFKNIIENTTDLNQLLTAVSAAQKYDLGMKISEAEYIAKGKFHDDEALLKLANKDTGFITGILMPSIDSKVSNSALPNDKLSIKEADQSATIRAGEKADIAQGFMENRQKINDFAGSVLYPFGKPAYAPASEEDAKKLQEQYDGSLFAKFNRVTGGATGEYVSGFTGGILKPTTEAPRDLSEKIVYDVSNILGSAKSIDSIGKMFGSFADGSTRVQEFIDTYPTFSKYAYPIIKNAVSFDVYGQLDPDTKDRFGKLAKDTLLSIPFTGLGAIKKAVYAVPASFALGFGLAKMDGASDQDAFVAGGILGTLDAYGRLGKKGEHFVTGRTSDRLLKVEATDLINKYGETKLKPDASAQEIKDAYKKAARKTHPDSGGDPEVFKKVTNAYNYLNEKYGATPVSESDFKPQEQPTQSKTDVATTTDAGSKTPTDTKLPEALPDLIQNELKKTGEVTTSPDMATPATDISQKNRSLNESTTEKIRTETLSGSREDLRLDKDKNVSIAANYGANNLPADTTTDTKVTVYRAGSADINNGDFVSLSKDNVQKYAEQRTDVKIYEKQVPLKDLVFSGGLKSEFVYAPKEANDPAKGLSLQEQLNKGYETTTLTPALREAVTKEKPEVAKDLKTYDQIDKLPEPRDGMVRLYNVNGSPDNINSSTYFADNLTVHMQYRDGATDGIMVIDVPEADLIRDNEAKNKQGIFKIKDDSAYDVTFYRPKRSAEVSSKKESDQIVETVKEGLSRGNESEAKDFYDSAKEQGITLPTFESIKSDFEAQSSKEEQKLSRGVKKELAKEKYGQYAPQVAKIKQFLAMNGEKKSKKTGELYREHVPENIAGVSSDVIANDLGMSEKELLNELMSTIEKGKYTPQPNRSYGGLADFGGYATLEDAKKGTTKISAIEFPELLAMVKEINQGIVPIVKNMSGGKLGALRTKEGVGANIFLNAEIFKDEQLASKVFAHELGHLVDFLPANTMKNGNLLGRLASMKKYVAKSMKTPAGNEITNKKVTEELKKLTQIWKPFDDKENEKFTKYRYSDKELYADALSVLFNDPQLLKETAPTFWRTFFDYLNKKPEVERTLIETYSLLTNGSETVLLNRSKTIDEMFKKGEDKYRTLLEENKQKTKSVKFRLMYEWQNKNYGIVEKVHQLQKQGVKIADDANPLYDLSEMNYIGGEIKSWLETNVDPIQKNLTDNELSWEQDLSKVMFLQRIEAGDRGEMANPLGYTPKTAKEQLAFMKEHMTEKQWSVLNESATLFRSSIKQLLTRPDVVELYTEEMIKTMRENPAYAAFQVLEYMEKNIPATVYKQVGTLKEISDVATSTLIKTISTIRAAERNKAKMNSVNLLKEYFKDEIKEAESKFDGKKQKIVEIDDAQTGTITVMEKGVPKGYYVDPYIADIFKVTTPKTQEITLQWLKTISNKAIKPAMTTINLGFQTFNTVKDFTRYWKAMPDKNIAEVLMSLPKGLNSYRKAVPHAYARAFGKPDKLIQEMEGKKILGITYNDLMDGMTEEDTRFQHIMSKYIDDGTPKNKNPLLKYPLAVLDGIRKVGDFVETLPKVAAYNDLQGRLPNKELAEYIRTQVGSPDFLKKGNAYGYTNTVFMFSNAIMQGNYADFQTMKNPNTRGGYWTKTILTNLLPKALMFAALIGLFGEEAKKMYSDMSEYDRTNYTLIPLGRENNRTIYMRIPSDENGSFIGGLFYKTLRLFNRDRTAEDNAKDFAAYLSGRLPNVSPFIQSVYATAQYLTGNNPYDFYRERNVIPEQEFKAGGMYSLKPFLAWQFQNLGGSVIWSSYVSEQSPETKSWGQKLLEMPVASNVLGRWVKISNYGSKEKANDIKKQMDHQDAARQIDERDKLNKAIDEYYKGDQTSERKKEIAKKLVTDIVGKTTSNDPKEKTKINNTIKKFKIGIEKKQGDPEVNTLIDAQTNDQKVELLKMYREQKTSDEFKSFVKDLYKNKIISDNVIQDLKKAKK